MANSAQESVIIKPVISKPLHIFIGLMIPVLIFVAAFFLNPYIASKRIAGQSVNKQNSGLQTTSSATVNPISQPSIIKSSQCTFAMVQWDNAVAVNKICEAVTPLVISKINQWSDGYEVPPNTRTDVHMPSANFDWWFATGEQVPNDQLDKFLATLSPNNYPRTFRLRDRSAIGNAAVTLSHQ